MTFKWDGKSRPSDDLYRKRFDEIFGKKEEEELKESYEQSKINRQERIFGTVNLVSDNEADFYFKSRPYESRIGAWASDQSNIMENRKDLIKKMEEYKKKYSDEKKLPRPKHWSGWCLNPSSIEFWLGDEFRIHERLRYNKISNKWKREIFYT